MFCQTCIQLGFMKSFSEGIFMDIFIGEDPLADIVDANSMNSIAGVLKSFFRELQEPILPVHLFDEFVEASSK